MLIPFGLIPPSPDQQFVNRQYKIDVLLDALVSKISSVVTISRLAGCGKSELIWYLANQQHAQFTVDQRDFLRRVRQAAQQIGDMDMITTINNKLNEQPIQP